MTYKDKLIKDLHKKLVKITKEYDEIMELLSILEPKEDTNVIPSKKVYVCLYKDSTQTFVDTPILYINRNKEIVEQVKDVIKNGYEVIVKDDSLNENDHDLLVKFANSFNIKMEK